MGNFFQKYKTRSPSPFEIKMYISFELKSIFVLVWFNKNHSVTVKNTTNYDSQALVCTAFLLMGMLILR